MVTIPTAVAGCLAVLFLVQAAPAAAQSTFADLPMKVKMGLKVAVEDEHGHKTLGAVQSVSESELVIAELRADASGVRQRHTFKPDDVRRVQKYGPIWDGAVKGASVTLIPMVVAIASGGCDGDCGAAAGATLLLGGMGAGIGLAIDAAIPPRTLFRHDPRAPRMALAPIIGHDRRGVAFSLRF